MRSAPRQPLVGTRQPVAAADVEIVPANEASWADLQAIFGQADYPGRCYCQGYKTYERPWNLTTEERRARMRVQANCGDPDAGTTSGLVAYLNAGAGESREPVGHVAVEPRVVYPRLLKKRTVWSGRDEDKQDPGVWSVTCLTVRKGYRRRGITYHLAAATVGYARDRGAAALEAYPMIVPPGKEITWGELHVGSVQVFEEAGFTEVSRPSPRRVVMRVDFAGGG
jgi:GNAT superfamily N-acetyltransferase